MLQRHESGCLLCGQDIPTTHRGVFKVHEIPWEEQIKLRAGANTRCRASGETPENVNRLLRTFECETNYDDVHHRPRRSVHQSVQLVDNGDGLGMVASLKVSGFEAATICLDLANEDLPRLRAEIDHIIAKRGLIPTEGERP
jgi:hypothetical protein